MTHKFFAAQVLNSTTAPLITKSQLKHAVQVAGLAARNGIRDAALVLFSFTTGLRVTEIAQVEIQHIMNRDGSFKLESWLPEKYSKSKGAPFYVSSIALQARLDAYFELRLAKGHQVTGKADYRGLNPTSKVFLTETGRKFSVTLKKREAKDYWASDVLEKLFKRIYRKAFGHDTKVSSHSGRRFFCNELMKLIESGKFPDADTDTVVSLMRSRDLVAIQPYMVPSIKEIKDIASNAYKDTKEDIK